MPKDFTFHLSDNLYAPPCIHYSTVHQRGNAICHWAQLKSEWSFHALHDAWKKKKKDHVSVLTNSHVKSSSSIVPNHATLSLIDALWVHLRTHNDHIPRSIQSQRNATMPTLVLSPLIRMFVALTFQWTSFTFYLFSLLSFWDQSFPLYIWRTNMQMELFEWVCEWKCHQWTNSVTKTKSFRAGWLQRSVVPVHMIHGIRTKYSTKMFFFSPFLGQSFKMVILASPIFLQR